MDRGSKEAIGQALVIGIPGILIIILCFIMMAQEGGESYYVTPNPVTEAEYQNLAEAYAEAKDLAVRPLPDLSTENCIPAACNVNATYATYRNMTSKRDTMDFFMDDATPERTSARQAKQRMRMIREYETSVARYHAVRAEWEPSRLALKAN